MMLRLSLTAILLLLSPLSNIHAAETVSIGTVLPLSGRFAAFGNKTLQGVELAVQQYNSTEAGKKTPVRLLIKDSQGVPDVAEKAVAELDREGASAIIGPILGVASESAARKAQELRVPIITMTQKEGVAAIGDHVFRNCITNAAQVKALVDFAVKDDVKSVAVLHPDNGYGKELASMFGAEAAKRKIKVAATHIYKEGQTDFAQEIKSIIALKSKKQKIDALFIPDYPEGLALLLPQLAYYDLKGVRLLGTSPWNSSKLLGLAGNYMNDSVFVDGFFVESQRPHVKEFVDLYRKTFDDDPGILEAQAFDTTGIVLSLIKEGKSARGWIRSGLLDIRDYAGVSGDISFKTRDAERSVYLLTVRYGRIEEMVGQ